MKIETVLIYLREDQGQRLFFRFLGLFRRQSSRLPTNSGLSFLIYFIKVFNPAFVCGISRFDLKSKGAQQALGVWKRKLG
jgi:hypothetical protein